MYTIKIYYRTGDSFHTEDTEQILEGSWDNLVILRANLERIKNHYKYYETIYGYSLYKLPELEEPENWNKEYPWQITLYLDNGNEWKFHAFWCGYFETLLGAEIVEINPIEQDKFWL